MALEERQTQIKEGAGLDESRLNQEFIELLRKYSTPILILITLLAGGYWYYNHRNTTRAKAIDDAYVSLNAALESRSASNILRAADDMSSHGAAKHLAHLAAADIFLERFRTGVPDGATLQFDGTLTPPEAKFLTDEEKTKQLDEAKRLYQIVAKDAAADTQLLLRLSALSGLAAVGEIVGDLDYAKANYDQIIQLASDAQMTSIAETFKIWRDQLPTLKDKPRIYSAAELVNADAPAVPFTSGLTNSLFKDAQGNPISLEPTAPPTIETEPAPPIPPTPVPTPTPAPTPNP